MPESKVTTVTREHRAEAARLLGFEPAPGGSIFNVYAHRWIVGVDVSTWWFEPHEAGERLPIVARALADRDARIGELEKSNGLLRGAIHRLEAAELAALAELDEAKAETATIKPPGTVAVQLPEREVRGDKERFLMLPNGAPLLDCTLGESEGPALEGVAVGTRFTPTLLLKPAGG